MQLPPIGSQSLVVRPNLVRRRVLPVAPNTHIVVVVLFPDPDWKRWAIAKRIQELEPISLKGFEPCSTAAGSCVESKWDIFTFWPDPSGAAQRLILERLHNLDE